MSTQDIIKAYFEAFNRGDAEAMIALLTEDVEHHVNQGGLRKGVEAFREFCAHMEKCYREELTDMVIFARGDRAAAEFTVKGTYLADDEGLPPAKGQVYELPAGSFFTLREGKIARVTTYYNLADWTAQVSA